MKEDVDKCLNVNVYFPLEYGFGDYSKSWNLQDGPQVS